MGINMIETLLLQQDLTDQERLLYMSEFQAQRKDSTTGVLLALFLGGIGGHHFYLGNNGVGVLYALFFWTFIPAIAATIEMFLMPKRVADYNLRKSMEIISRIKLMRPRPQQPELQSPNFSPDLSVVSSNVTKSEST
jgi:TM2 domain-containing membrane protein YozV